MLLIFFLTDHLILYKKVYASFMLKLVNTEPQRPIGMFYILSSFILSP